MKNRLTERDLSRIVKRVISEQGEVVAQPTDDLYKQSVEFMQKLKKLYPGIDGGKASLIAKTLMGIWKDPATGIWSVKYPDMNERLKRYDYQRTKNGLTQLPSGDMISLFLTLK